MRMNMLYKAWLLVGVSVAAMQPLLLGRSSAPSSAVGCKDSHRTLTPRNPRRTADGHIAPGQAIVQAKFN